LPGFGSRKATRQALEGRAGAPYLVPIALTLLALGAGWWLKDAAPRITGAVASPEAQVRQALSNLTSARLEDVYGHASGGLAELQALRFRDVTVRLEGERAHVVAMADGQGRVAWRGQVATLAYLGREEFTMRPCAFAGWCAEGEALGELRPILRLLFRRLDAEAGRDAGAYARLLAEPYRGAEGRAAVVARLARALAAPSGSPSATAWQIRADRGEAVVGEDGAVAGPGGPAPRRLRLTLARQGERWVIADGL